MTDAGAMRETIIIQARSSAQDETGDPLLTWSEVGRRRAEKTSGPGGERFSAETRVGRVPTIFRIRYPRALTVKPAMRVVHRDVVFDIKSVDDRDGRRVDLFLTCEELIEEPT